MKRFTTIIGGGLGWALGGPIGAILGAALGTIFSEEISNVKKSSKIFKNPETDFHASLLVLASVVIKADGKIDRRELDFVRRQFVKWFGINKTNNSFNVFKSLIKTEPNLLKICQQIKRNMPLHGRIQIISFLFDLSFADGTISSNENKQIARISSYLGISSQEFHQLESIKIKKVKDPYEILGITSSSSDKELKKMYRKLVKKYHPDSLHDMGKEVVLEAENTFRKIQESYEEICQRREIK